MHHLHHRVLIDEALEYCSSVAVNENKPRAKNSHHLTTYWLDGGRTYKDKRSRAGGTIIVIKRRQIKNEWSHGVGVTDLLIDVYCFELNQIYLVSISMSSTQTDTGGRFDRG